MPNVLDSFVVELGLDPSKFTQGQKDALEALRQTTERAVAGGKEIEAQGAKVTEYFGKLKREALGFVGLLVGGQGVKQLIENLTTLDAATNRSARLLNVSASELSAWQGAARQAGGSAASITGALSGFNMEINRFQVTGNAAFLPALNAMGIYLKNFRGEVKPTTELMLEMSAAMKEMNPTNQGRAASHLMMIPGMNLETVNLLLKGPDAIRRLLDESRSISNVTKESAEASERLAAAWAKAAVSAEGFGRKLLTFFSPLLEGMLALSDLLRGTLTPEEKKENAARQQTLHDKLGQKFGKPTGFLGELSDWLSIRDQVSFSDWIKMTPSDTSRFMREHGQSASPSASSAPFTGKLGNKLVVITTNGGRKVSVAEESADAFRGFLNDLEAGGAPIGSLGGYSPRTIKSPFGVDTGVWSEHARGQAIDMGSMTGRNRIDPALRSWIDSHDRQWRELLSRYNMRSGGDFKHPDLGHVEHLSGLYGYGGIPGGAASAVGMAGGGMSDRRSYGNTSNSVVHIAKVEVITSATDADGIARDFTASVLARANSAASANYALG